MCIHVPCLGLPFTTSKVHQVQLPAADMGFAIAREGRVAGLDRDGEDGVGARGVLIHECGPDSTILLPHVQHVLYLLDALAAQCKKRSTRRH